jgi:hypothetical protein
MIKLGNKVRCIVSGFEGIAAARVEYLNGCTQYCVVPAARDNKKEDGIYIDHQQLEVIEGGIEIDPANTGGPQLDTPASTYRGC